jgi:NADPH:quinone reductase
MNRVSALPQRTRAVAAVAAGSPAAAVSFIDTEVAVPPLGDHDLLVGVRAVSVNPVDLKIAAGLAPGDAPRVLGYDASGVVIATGAGTSRFEAGDEVYYAGSVTRPGANARLHVVDARLAGRKPASLGFAQAAALPLATITAWESLFLHLGLDAASSGTLLVVGGAGGVGSMVTQLARARTGATVIATASRPESAAWARRMGASAVVNPRRLADDVPPLAPHGVQWVFSAYSAGMAAVYAGLLGIGGTVVAIDDPPGLDIRPLREKSQAWRWEAMFSRPRFDPGSTLHGDILDHAATLADAGTVTTTLTRQLTGLTPKNLRQAHEAIASARSIGKTVIACG